MKTKRLFLIAASVCCMALFAACGATRGTEEVEISGQPCSDCFSTNDLIRARGMGESRDQQMALEKARSNALAALGSKIKVSMEALMENYSVNRTENEEEDFKSKSEKFDRRIVDETIQGYRTICEKYTVRKDKNGTKIYKCYYVVELGKADATSSLYKGLSSGKTSLDMDYEKFRMKFQQELSAHDNDK